MPHDLRSPWKEFLDELDGLLQEPMELHCVGGFAVVAAYGLPRSTNDLDYFSMTPRERTTELHRIAGEGSTLSSKHKVHIHQAAVASMPEGYQERLTELFPRRFKNLRLLVPDPYDIVLSKLGRNESRDREDVKYLSKTQNLDPNVLKKRYDDELRVNLIGPPEQHDLTFRFWLEAYFTDSR